MFVHCLDILYTAIIACNTVHMVYSSVRLCYEVYCKAACAMQNPTVPDGPGKRITF